MRNLPLLAAMLLSFCATAQNSKSMEKKELTLDAIWGGNYLDEQKPKVRLLHGEIPSIISMHTKPPIVKQL